MKKVLSMLVIVLMVACICTSVSAVSVDSIINTSNKAVTNESAEAMNKFGGTIIGYITSAAMVIAVVVIAVLGVMYMLASSEGKAEYKKNFVPLIVGALLVFGAGTVAKIILGLVSSF